jgi:BlaI family penicillinase repressor
MPNDIPGLSRRESQIMDVLYRIGEATVGEVHGLIKDAPSYSAVRATMNVLEEKGHLRHRQDGQRYVYLPTVPQEKAKVAALKHLVGTFFNGSAEQAAMALLELSDTKIPESDLKRLAARIRDAKREGR